MPVKEIHNHDYTRGMVRYTIHVEEDKAVKCGVRGIATSATLAVPLTNWQIPSTMRLKQRKVI